ncbi:MAG: hypothetical protein ACREBW_10325 [Candidatus Micrarchaeaceae archaeon]
MAMFDWDTKASQGNLDDAQMAFEDYLQVESTADKSARYMFYWGYMFGRGLIKGVVNDGEEKGPGKSPAPGVESSGDKGETGD